MPALDCQSYQVLDQKIEIGQSRNRISQAAIKIHQSQFLQDILSSVALELQQILAVDRVVICQLQMDKQGIVMAEALEPGWPISLGHTITDPLELHQAALVHGCLSAQAIKNIDEVLFATRYGQGLRQYAAKSVLSVPLVLGNQCWGVLMAQHCAQVHAWALSECALAEEMGAHLAIAIDKAIQMQQQQQTIADLQQAVQRLQEKNYQLKSLASQQNIATLQTNAQLKNKIVELEQTNQTLEFQTTKLHILADFILKVRQAQEIEDILQTMVCEVQKCLQVDRILVYRINPDGAGKVIAEAVLPEWPATLGSEFSQALFSQQCQHSLLQLPYKAVQDVVAAYQDVSPPLLSALANWGVRAKVVVPILQQSESWGFIIAHQCSDTRLWAEIELELLTQIAAHVSISIAQAERQQQLTASNKVECIG